MKTFLLGVGLALWSAAPAAALEYGKDKALPVPADYREWVFLTASLDLNYNEPVPGAPVAAPAKSLLDNVFVTPAAYRVFLKTGTWPEETVFVKENRIAAAPEDAIGKSGKVQERVVSIELHVKDTKHFPGGWAFFVSDGKAPARYLPPPAGCYACHQDHAAVDTVFVQFYPTLVDVAKAHGVYKGK